jgi:hypothetical protein
MKNLSKLILGIVFVFGVMPSSNAKAIETEKIDAVEETVPCPYVFEVCDVVFPDDYRAFDSCMQSNGC